MIPGVAAEQFVCAFARKTYFEILTDPFAKQQQGCIHIRHTGQRTCVYRFCQRIKQLGVVNLDRMMVGVDGICHDADKLTVGCWLEQALLKILVVVMIIDRIGVDGRFSVSFAVLCGGVRNDARIQTARQKAKQRHIRNKLSFDGIRHKLSDLTDALREIGSMFLCL